MVRLLSRRPPRSPRCHASAHVFIQRMMLRLPGEVISATAQEDSHLHLPYLAISSPQSFARRLLSRLGRAVLPDESAKHIFLGLSEGVADSGVAFGGTRLKIGLGNQWNGRPRWDGRSYWFS